MPSAATKTPARKTTKPPSRGGDVCRWVETHCVLAEGDYYGKPFTLHRWQQQFLWRLYEQSPSGGRLWRRALLGLPRGNGKSELAAAVAAYELMGAPVLEGDHWVATRTSPVVTVAAASWEQADIPFGVLKAMCRESPVLQETTQVFDSEILRLDAPGRAYRVAAVAGTNEGQRPTCVIADELHEWLGAKERVWTVLTSGAAKRVDSLTLAITTAGFDRSSICYRMYERGKRIAAGEMPPERFLMEWYEAPEGLAVDDLDALRACNPAIGSGFLSIDDVLDQVHVLPEREARRYHLNQWTQTEAAWLPPGAWEALPTKPAPKDGERVVLAFHGAYSRSKGAALVGCTLEGHVFVLDSWERPEGAPEDWTVTSAEVNAAVSNAFRRYDVAEMPCNFRRWTTEAEQWAESYGAEVVTDFNTFTPAKMSPACSRFYAAVTTGQGITHDGNPRLARHLANAVTKPHADGEYISEESPEAPHRIHLAKAAVMAYDRAMYHSGEGEVLVEFF